MPNYLTDLFDLENVLIPKQKLLYLLKPQDEKAKGHFFLKEGFTEDSLRAALIWHISTNPISKQETRTISEPGEPPITIEKFVVKGPMPSPSRTFFEAVSVWKDVDGERVFVSLTTSYPDKT